MCILPVKVLSFNLFTAADRHSLIGRVPFLPHRSVPEALRIPVPPEHRQIQRLLRHCRVLCAEGTSVCVCQCHVLSPVPLEGKWVGNETASVCWIEEG